MRPCTLSYVMILSSDPKHHCCTGHLKLCGSRCAAEIWKKMGTKCGHLSQNLYEVQQRLPRSVTLKEILLFIKQSKPLYVNNNNQPLRLPNFGDRR